MGKSLTILFVAYATGLICVGWLIHFVKQLPMHTYMKVLLVIVMPIPPACIGWAVTYWGPSPGDMETIKPIHYAAVAETVCEGLGAGAFSMIVLFGAKLAGGRFRERRRRPKGMLSREALDSIGNWTRSCKRHRPTAKELLGRDDKPEEKEEKRVISRTYFGRAPD